MSVYSLKDVEQFTKKESKRFTKLFEKFKFYDKIDILIELSKRKRKNNKL